jgi:tRNA threonylcarbamoyladenosine biosynthesis protein TsaE
LKLLTKSEAETEEIAYKLGLSLKKRDQGATVCLLGDLGCGKTVFTKGLARAFGLKSREITSASFTIIAEHDSTPPFCHIDLYRLQGGENLDELGIYEYMDSHWITAIEWADRLPPGDTDGTIVVEISFIDKDTREIIIEGND